VEILNTLVQYDSHKDDTEVDILAQKVGKKLGKKNQFHVAWLAPVRGQC
jgi:hypothetical protein